MSSLGTVFLFLILTIPLLILPLSYAPMGYGWNSKPQIVWEESGGETILTITFDFAEMSAPPTPTHYPKRFQIRTSLDGADWTKLDPIPITPRPTTTLFNVTYNLGEVSETLQIQTRLECSIHSWSIWSKTFIITSSGEPAGGGAQGEKTTITTTVTTTTTSTTTSTTVSTATSTTTQMVSTTITQTTTSFLTTTQKETLTETKGATVTEKVSIIEPSALALLGAGIAIAGIAVAYVLTKRK